MPFYSHLLKACQLKLGNSKFSFELKQIHLFFTTQLVTKILYFLCSNGIGSFVDSLGSTRTQIYSKRESVQML